MLLDEEKEPLPRRSRWPSADKPAKPEEAEAPPQKPVMLPVMRLPTNEEAVLTNLISREVINPTGPYDPPSLTLQLLAKTIQAIANGEDIAPYRQHLERVTANKPEKSDLLLAILDQINDERIPRLLEMQDNSERVVASASRRRDITVPEALIAWKIANGELIAILKAKMDHNQPVDGKAAVEKISVSQQQIDESASLKWENTSPHGREIIRKKLWQEKQAILAERAAAAAEQAAAEAKT